VVNNQPNPVVPTPGPQPVPTPMPGPSVPPGYIGWMHPQGAVALAFPAGYVSAMQPGLTPPFTLLSMADPATYTGCDVMHITGTQDPSQAFGYIQSYFAGLGLSLQASSSQMMPNGAVMLSGMTSSMGGATQWICVAKAVPGGVIFVSAGAPPQMWQMQSGTIQSIIASVRFAQ
jgi:hypothetical protein